MPKYAVISVGKDNSYGHPTEALLSRLRDADVKTFRTDMQGDIYCTSDGKNVSFSVSKNKDANVFGNIGSNSTSKPASTPSTSSTVKPAAKEESIATENKQSTMVWVPKTGSKYHSKSSCSNMKNPSQVPIEQAIANGYTACKKCY